MPAFEHPAEAAAAYPIVGASAPTDAPEPPEDPEKNAGAAGAGAAIGVEQAVVVNVIVAAVMVVVFVVGTDSLAAVVNRLRFHPHLFVPLSF